MIFGVWAQKFIEMKLCTNEFWRAMDKYLWVPVKLWIPMKLNGKLCGLQQGSAISLNGECFMQQELAEMRMLAWKLIKQENNKVWMLAYLWNGK